VSSANTSGRCEKGKPVARRGRKANDLLLEKAAWLPNGWV